MFYQSPLNKANSFLNNGGYTMDSNDENFINTAKQQGYDENMYIPIIASKKMRQEDQRLSNMYSDYKASPTTFMSNFKSQYGEEGRGVIGDTLGFMKNLFVDAGENVEELAGMVIHPIDTAKSLGTLGKGLFTDKAVRKAVFDGIKEGVLSKESFYENPFDFLSTIIPIVGQAGKIGKAGELTKMAKLAYNAKRVGVLEDMAKWGKQAEKAGGLTGIVGKAAQGISFAESSGDIISKLADLVNWDIHAAKALGKGAGNVGKKIGGIAQGVLGELVYTPDFKGTLKTLFEKSRTKEGRQALSEFAGMNERQIAEQGIRAADKFESLRTSATRSKLGEYYKEAPVALGEKQYSKIFGENVFSQGANKFVFSEGDKGKFVKITESEGVTGEAAKMAEDTINQAFKESFNTKGKLTSISKLYTPAATEKFINRANSLLARTSDPLVKDIVSSYLGKWKKVQGEMFSNITESRKIYKEFSDTLKTIKIGTGEEAIDKMLAYIRKTSKTGTHKGIIQDLAKNTGFDLESAAASLASRKYSGRFMGQIMGLGLAGSGVGLATGGVAAGAGALLPIVGAAALTSPAIVYQIVTKIAGPVLQGKSAGIRLAKKVAKTLDVSVDDVVNAAKNVANNPQDISGYMNALKQLGKTPLQPRALSFFERANRQFQEQLFNQGKSLQEEAGKMEGYGLENMQSTEPQIQTQDVNAQYQSQLQEGEQINPAYLHN